MAGGRYIVLVHGAWHGAWCWDAVAEILRAQGHKVSTPTQTGLGERQHLLSTRPDLETFIDDIVQHILDIGVHDIVLVGHSFAGMVISGVADRIPERLRQLIYIDGDVVENGLAAIDRMEPAARQARLQDAEQNHRGLGFTAPPAARLGINDPILAAKVEARLSPQPLGSYTTPLRLANPLGNGVTAKYVMCTAPQYQDADRIAGWLERHCWPLHRLAAGHDAMLTHPETTAALIARLAEDPASRI